MPLREAEIKIILVQFLRILVDTGIVDVDSYEKLKDVIININTNAK